jgi:gamma-glutamylcyclotransferase (GGCT)/AIG2-like uncharacterized protein YtfP
LSTIAASSRLFAYGTLMMPTVLRAICGDERRLRPAQLPGYARFRVRGQVFPGIVPAAGARTDGVVVDDIDPALWRRLDAFESDLYERRPVTVATADDQTLDACAYIVAARHRHILSQDAWCPAAFAATELEAYLARWT